jgi:hypothetical protein
MASAVSAKERILSNLFLDENLEAFTHAVGNDERFHSQEALYGIDVASVRQRLHFVEDSKLDKKVLLTHEPHHLQAGRCALVDQVGKIHVRREVLLANVNVRILVSLMSPVTHQCAALVLEELFAQVSVIDGEMKPV